MGDLEKFIDTMGEEGPMEFEIILDESTRKMIQKWKWGNENIITKKRETHK